ncbi:MAG: hypothetical protein IPG45_30425 [Deltaproteobacteria bacterium]|nr:hypothetical protein [Deltaproteobacteria bacterium]
MSFVGALSSSRALRILSEEEKLGGKKKADVGKRQAVALDEFRGLHVAEKVLRQHGASFAPAVAEMEAIEARISGMDEHRGKQAGRALEAFYAKVGTMLADTPIADRPKAVKAAVKEARALVEHTAYDDLVAPALAAMADLLGYAKKAPDAAKAVRAAVTELLDLTDGRTGATSALNVYPNIVWHIENNAPLVRPAERFERWGAIARSIAEVLPRTKLDQVDVTNLATLITEELEKKPKDHQGALERAATRAKQGSEGLYRQLREDVNALPAGVQPGTPAGAAFQAIANAISATVDANPTGPAALSEALSGLLATAAQVRGADAERQRGWETIGAAIQAAARTSSIEALVKYFSVHAPNLVANRAAVAELAAGAELPRLPSALIRAASAAMGVDVNRQDVKDGVTHLLKLRPTAALQGAIAASASLGHGAEPASLFWVTAQFAATSPVAGTQALQTFLDRFTTILPQIRPQLGDAKALPAAYAIARANLVEGLSAPRAQQIAELCCQIAQAAPQAPLPELIADDANKRPGIITLSNTDNLRWQAPVQYLVQLLPQLAAVNLPASAKLALTRHAMSIASEVAKLDRDPNTIWNRVVQDWQSALGQPNALHFGIRAGRAVDVRANLGGMEDGAAVRFLREHAVIPPELAFTASIRLSPEQIGWLRDFLSTERSRMQVRNVRDTIFTAMDTNRLNFIEALRTTRAPRGVVARITTFVAAEMRGGRANAVPFDALMQGLAKGEDPMPAIERARLGGGGAAVAQQPGAVDAVAVMDLMGMGNVKADPETIASMKRALPDLQALIGGLPAGGQVQGAPSSLYRDPILACLQSMVDGTWPAIKYDNDTGRRALDGLTPEQKAIWMDEWVTPLNEQAGVAPPQMRPIAAKNPAALADAMRLVHGLAKALPLEVKLGVAGMPPLDFDQASADRLRAELEAVREQIHAAVKGTPEHRELSTKVGPLSVNLAVIELQLALDAVARGGEGDPAKTIVELVPLLEAAASATRKLGGRGSSEAIKRVLEVAPEPPAPVKRNPRHGVYAADEDNLEAWVTSFDAGCIASKAGQNRMSQAEFISGAQYKMLRVCSDNNGVTRSMFRLYKVEMPGYKGHAIWMDSPMTVARGHNPTQEMYTLAYKHGLKKAMAMGVPFMFSSQQGNQAAQAAGLPVQQMAVKMSIDRGNTGLHHAQGIAGGHYFVAWPMAQGCGYVNAQEASNTYEQNYNFSVVMPPR